MPRRPSPDAKKRTPAQEKIHKAALARRREANHAKKREAAMIAAAEQAAEGDTNFDALVEAQKGKIAAAAARAASQPPKTIRLARENLTEAFDFMGGVAGLVVWGKQNPTEFYRIWARLIPKEAAPEAETMPLEQLLAKLAEREHLSVTEAAMQIGTEKLEEGRRGAAAEDAARSDDPPGTQIILH